jgi:hypothetical protein
MQWADVALTRVVELLNIVGRNAMLLQEIQALVREPHLLIHRKSKKRHGMSIKPKREATSPRRWANQQSLAGGGGGAEACFGGGRLLWYTSLQASTACVVPRLPRPLLPAVRPSPPRSLRLEAVGPESP